LFDLDSWLLAEQLGDMQHLQSFLPLNGSSPAATDRHLHLASNIVRQKA
jgi:hypothetical protein